MGDQVKLLSIPHRSSGSLGQTGVLCIGDAAHAMSPIGGVGVNPAIQDAVAAANALIPPLRQHRLQLKHLLSVQRRREFPTRAIQFLQIKMSQRKPGERRAAGGSRDRLASATAAGCRACSAASSAWVFAVKHRGICPTKPARWNSIGDFSSRRIMVKSNDLINWSD